MKKKTNSPVRPGHSLMSGKRQYTLPFAPNAPTPEGNAAWRRWMTLLNSVPEGDANFIVREMNRIVTEAAIHFVGPALRRKHSRTKHLAPGRKKQAMTAWSARGAWEDAAEAAMKDGFDTVDALLARLKAMVPGRAPSRATLGRFMKAVRGPTRASQRKD